jgi:transcription elongation factor Elf1
MEPLKCPKCGEDRESAIEIVGKLRTKIEIFCNTCGKSSIIDTDERSENEDD